MKIAVVGCGVVGLTSAIRLGERGHDVTILAERRTPNTTSDRAGAVFTPFRAEGGERIRGWTARSLAAYQDLAREPESGVRLAPLRVYYFTPQDSAPWWTAWVERARPVEPAPTGYAAVFEADVPHIRMGTYLPWLERRFTAELRGRIVTRRVDDLQTLFAEGFAVVVNCTGLGARELAGDAAVSPLRGQVMQVANTLDLRGSLLEEGRGDITTYVFAFDEYVVLGGTYEADQWTERTDDGALAGILERCRALLRADGHPEWRRLGEKPLRSLAGLRPVRRVGDDLEAVRLESEQTAAGRVIHNYGHGRAGVSLSWGCAAEVPDKVDAMGRGDT